MWISTAYKPIASQFGKYIGIDGPGASVIRHKTPESDEKWAPLFACFKICLGIVYPERRLSESAPPELHLPR
jgi:hypothetical protein